jgi:acyl carrier protein
MDETEARLRRCFSAVFPSLSGTAILEADATNTEAWDSVASVTLFATIEEEFGIQIDLADAVALLSFVGLLDYLRTRTASKPQ